MWARPRLGMELERAGAELPIETVQYHPEGAPGPLDALAVFDRFVAALQPA